MPQAADALLVHLAAGIGNIVLATPLLAVLARGGFMVDVRVDGDYPDTADLLRDWGALRNITIGVNAPLASYRAVLPAIPPFYWARYAATYRRVSNAVPRPADHDFYRDEQAWYLAFARGFSNPAEPPPYCTLPVAPCAAHGISRTTLALAPGCKGGEMSAKRWPHFTNLATQFPEVVVLGAQNDLEGSGRVARPSYPAHVLNLVGRLTLRETAMALAACGAVVANDSGLGHIAAALGVPTILLFGPTPFETLGRFPPNVTVLRPALPCAPCWFAGRFAACGGGIDCLEGLAPSDVAAAVRASGFGGG